MYQLSRMERFLSCFEIFFSAQRRITRPRKLVEPLLRKPIEPLWRISEPYCEQIKPVRGIDEGIRGIFEDSRRATQTVPFIAIGTSVKPVVRTASFNVLDVYSSVCFNLGKHTVLWPYSLLNAII